MSQQQQQGQRERSQERARDDSRRESSSQQRTTEQTAVQGADEERKCELAVEEARITAGKDGARNLQAQWITVPLPNVTSCRFAITTAAGHAIEAVTEQKNYSRSYQGTSSLQTAILPAAPHGTKGKLTVRDVETGETLEQPWIWNAGVGGLFSVLWALLKKLFT
ncbi:MAG TPA: hypothetical protein VIY50_06265 [Steroidobacteraceae bacterium]